MRQGKPDFCNLRISVQPSAAIYNSVDTAIVLWAAHKNIQFLCYFQNVHEFWGCAATGQDRYIRIYATTWVLSNVLPAPVASCLGAGCLQPSIAPRVTNNCKPSMRDKKLPERWISHCVNLFSSFFTWKISICFIHSFTVTAGQPKCCIPLLDSGTRLYNLWEGDLLIRLLSRRNLLAWKLQQVRTFAVLQKI